MLKLAAERRQAERKDRIAQKLEDETYVEAGDMLKNFQVAVNSLELLPQKLESEFALPPATVKRHQQLIDEARQSIADFIRNTDSKRAASK